MIRASIPSPQQSLIEIGPLTIHFYALCIIAGVVAAIYIGNRRFVAAGGAPGVVGDVAILAVPAGIIGGRIYHVITSPELYFGVGKDWKAAFLYLAGWLGNMGRNISGISWGAHRVSQTRSTFFFIRSSCRCFGARIVDRTSHRSMG